MKYHFYAVLQQEGKDYNVYFPDLPGAITFGNDIEDAVFMAQDALEGHLLVMEDDGDDIPEPSEYKKLVNNLEVNEQLQLVTVDTKLVRIKEENKTVNKMVTLPKYMVVLGKEKGINFSQTLQRALKEELNI
ncbi:type II toxin-antitoxin system HicB family antitoxin [Staphylococcus delphini]|uniref:type II toxin-antitoxin system HicB family antitoxin n=1 Tax=Staphylococcus delphini TaxID=53344 RepID=UPI0021D14962|nr:type II toxin-antitoxin system HicB family antitoxin [Staphylococcus delphini]UXS22602.1 type II toxin-antitoxin system HicB family antitoxin [Staphylococcus delphini]UXS30202.1 type II toxin-antitoxin system HicB family antitoxin [Staphylococcus delphini]UXS37875.1 type II toxin-antitoxin system HicB family antitoxin [Staphylococcus delphini]UXS45354.1 type II toxin-antitoxin system HicB family antitoxin [Staphylococcus delphini]UXS58541.1 type II toxin-antitoxin system HicB family antitox